MSAVYHSLKHSAKINESADRAVMGKKAQRFAQLGSIHLFEAVTKRSEFTKGYIRH